MCGYGNAMGAGLRWVTEYSVERGGRGQGKRGYRGCGAKVELEEQHKYTCTVTQLKIYISDLAQDISLST